MSRLACWLGEAGASPLFAQQGNYVHLGRRFRAADSGVDAGCLLLLVVAVLLVGLLAWLAQRAYRVHALRTLNHPGRLNEEQWELVRKHPTDGFRALCHRSDVNWGQLMMTYQHHERLDGRGYPVGVVGKEIHDWARICKVADVFDALSSDRPYRKAEPINKVLEFLEQRIGTEFDEDMVQCLQATVNCKS